MESKFNRISYRVILIAIAIGIWAIVLQNAGVIPTNQNVYVVNTVPVDGDVKVRGSVSVNNTVSVSVDEVLHKDGKKYYFSNY